MLSIGSIYGGPEISATLLGKGTNRLMNLVAQECENFISGSTGAINVVFHVPGSVFKEIPYEGLRDGKFSRKEKMLMIQVAVPKQVVASKDSYVVREFLFWSLREANYLGAKYFKKKNIEYSQPKFLGLVDAVEAKFKETPLE